MKRFILFCILVLALKAEAQTYLPYNSGHNFLQNRYMTGNFAGFDSGKKWFVSRYSGLTAGLSFFNGGSANFIAAPIGLQLNRRINNNVFAFAGLSAVPNYTYFNQAFTGAHMANGNPYRMGNLGLSSRAEVGVMYVNDERTFSVSGSIGVERNNYQYGIPPLNRQGIQQVRTNH